MGRNVRWLVRGGLALGLLAALPAWAGGAAKTVRVWGDWVAPAPGMTVEQTRRAALDSARAKAVEQAGVRVDAAGLYQGALERLHFLQSLARGVIVGERQLRWENREVRSAEAEFPLTAYRVEIEAEVVALPEPADPGFVVEAELNRTAFEAGDEARITLRSRRPAWAYVFNLMADDRAALLFPNPYQRENRLAPGREVAFPKPGCGVCLEMQPLRGDPESAEAFLVVAFPEPVALAERFPPGEPVAITEFYRRLTAFPLESAAMRLLPYTVRAKPE
ncbi:MAG: DUF4384 domain-containing protein [Candidatus Dadabacteria bacterium]|nr:MAG: DUF4384 domain-containing protein [Candidatus Dadabacteria bacterium]